MTHLLGRQDCVDSLRKDVTDLQGTILDVMSRAGPARFPSWKFPDKVSCDLDLVTLLEHYDFVEGDEEFSQHSHIALLELVVDRLLLLLQSFTRYTDVLLAEAKGSSQSRVIGPSMSIGLVVKRYWNSLLKVGNLYQHTLRERKSADKEASKLQMKAAEQESLRDKANSSTASLIRAKDQTSTPVPDSCARDSRTVGCQTLESSLVPCDACARSQASLKEVSNTIINICQSQNLPSSLCRFREAVQGTLGEKPLSSTDMAYWASEQSKDLARINKHFGDLLNLVSPLKESLAASEKKQAELKQSVECFKGILHKEKGEHQIRIQEFQSRMEEMSMKNEWAVKKLEGEREELRKGTLFLEERNSRLKEELTSQQASIDDLERKQEALLEEMRTQLVDKGVVLVLEERVRGLRTQLDSSSAQLSSTITELDKEKAKFHSMCRQQESLQLKQRALLQRVDALDQECEELKSSLGDQEEHLSQLSEERAVLQSQLAQQQVLTEELQQEKQRLEQSVIELQRSIFQLEGQVQEQKEREKLLVSFPDLCDTSQCPLESTGDVVTDMQKQLQANSLRISVLEEDNSRLRNSLSKLRESTPHREYQLIPQKQLWSHSSASQKQDNLENTERSTKDSNSSIISWENEGTIKMSTSAGSPAERWEKRTPAAAGGYRLAPTVSFPAHSLLKGAALQGRRK
ncbi:coiled-coil domain-containing protein 157-like isoform X1 [Acipenser ruthenus]|uniref:coiled-coil domain-containing protein 157-like isoform X1 n=1 Tax=Acipenser ruthenus TaxID=7906 RepID=UPI002740DCD0|nr:coiled-coil domain-containing protein 157-like isoform X1 [Acipenser ruthenus]XP_058889264.1 coiled-coil domain-containing protein 157-like isoform X1 [Acipenser ruthenus]